MHNSCCSSAPLQGSVCRDVAGLLVFFFFFSYTSWDLQDSEGKRGTGWVDLASRYGWLVVSLNVAVLESLGDLGDVEFQPARTRRKKWCWVKPLGRLWLVWTAGRCSGQQERCDWLPVIVPLIFAPSSLILESGQISITGLIW